MSLKQTKQSGFTIVELLIVVVIIAILAAITIVAYNGIQQRANNSASASAANTVMKKIEAANAINTGYPADTTVVNYTATLAADATTTLVGTGITITAANPTSANGKTTVKIDRCSTGGAKIYFWDYTAASGAGAVTAAPLLLGNTTTCAALT